MRSHGEERAAGGDLRNAWLARIKTRFPGKAEITVTAPEWQEFAEEIADVIGPVQMGYTHRVRHRFFSAFNDFLLSQLVRLLNEAQDRVGFAAEVSQQIQGYLQ